MVDHRRCFRVRYSCSIFCTCSCSWSMKRAVEHGASARVPSTMLWNLLDASSSANLVVGGSSTLTQKVFTKTTWKHCVKGVQSSKAPSLRVVVVEAQFSSSNWHWLFGHNVMQSCICIGIYWNDAILYQSCYSHYSSLFIILNILSIDPKWSEPDPSRQSRGLSSRSSECIEINVFVERLQTSIARSSGPRLYQWKWSMRYNNKNNNNNNNDSNHDIIIVINKNDKHILYIIIICILLTYSQPWQLSFGPLWMPKQI